MSMSSRDHHRRSSWNGSGVIRRRNQVGGGLGECERIDSSMTDSSHVRVRSWLYSDISVFAFTRMTERDEPRFP
jgi:hypothetical protein